MQNNIESRPCPGCGVARPISDCPHRGDYRCLECERTRHKRARLVRRAKKRTLSLRRLREADTLRRLDVALIAITRECGGTQALGQYFAQSLAANPPGSRRAAALLCTLGNMLQVASAQRPGEEEALALLAEEDLTRVLRAQLGGRG